MQQREEGKSRNKKDSEYGKLWEEDFEDKLLDEYLERNNGEEVRGDNFYENAEHALEKRSPFIFGRRRRRRRRRRQRSCPSAPSRCKLIELLI